MRKTTRVPRGLWAAALCALITPNPTQASLDEVESYPRAEGAADDSPTATLVGFRRTGPKSAQVYVKLTKAVSVSRNEQGKTITFTLSGTKVMLKNNKNPLLTEHFGTAVESVRLVPDKKDVKLVIQLKRDATLTSQVVTETDGAVLYVDVTEP